MECTPAYSYKRMSETATATALVQAARRIFARRGYDGTSVRAITADAGANLGAITYHFGSKRELYDRVVESVVQPLAERIEGVLGGEGDVLERVERVVRVYFEYLAENPDLPQLMMQELVMAAEPSEALAAQLKRVHGGLTGLVEEGQAQGVIRRGPARALGIFILSVPVHLALLQRSLLRHLVLDLVDADSRRQVVESAVAFVRSGLRDGTGALEV
jgi:AcrR family transcriptional regulator